MRVHPHLAFAALLVILASLSFPSSAATIKKLPGTYTKSQIADACDKAGGIFVSGEGNFGYGCAAKTGGVNCTPKGECTGVTKDLKAVPGTVITIDDGGQTKRGVKGVGFGHEEVVSLVSSGPSRRRYRR